jgi:hypothetical protein
MVAIDLFIFNTYIYRSIDHNHGIAISKAALGHSVTRTALPLVDQEPVAHDARQKKPSHAG